MIENEKQEIEYFNNRSLDGHMSGWGSVGQWGELKRSMLEFIWPFESMLDIGCGDMIYLSSFKPFANNKFDYLGLDGSSDVIDKAMKKHPLHNFRELTISEMLGGKLSRRYEVIVCYDVLFHIIEEGLYKNLLRWLFSSSAKYILLTYLRVNEEDHQKSDKGHFVIRDFGRIPIPKKWTIKIEKRSDKKSRQRIALLSRTND